MSLIRISSHTALQEPLLPVHSVSGKRQSPMKFISEVVSALPPRKPRQRITLLILLSLISLSAYIILTHQPMSTLALQRSKSRPAPSHLALALESIQHSRISTSTRTVAHSRQVQLSSAQELAAISSFLASLPQNQIPYFVDPSQPIDPQLVLDFDTRGPRASEEVEAMVKDVWTSNPVFLYSKRYSAASREVKTMLDSLNLKPSPTVIDVDVRDDADVLLPILARLTSSAELPILIVGGKPVASIQEIRESYENGELRHMITNSGALIDGARRRKKKH